MLIVKDEIVEDPHHRGDDGVCPLLVDRHAGGAVAVRHFEDAAGLLREGYMMRGDHKRYAGHQGARAPNPLDGTSSRSSDRRFPVSVSSPTLRRQCGKMS